MKKLLAAFLAILTAASAPVQAQSQSQQLVIQFKYNLNSTTETYCALGNEVTDLDRVQDATSTTMTAVSGTPFANVAVGDMITGVDQPSSGGESFVNSVVARASATSITINTAISPDVNPTLTSATLKHRTLACGTAPNSGAFNVAIFKYFTVQIDIQQMVLLTPGTSSIDTRIVCRTGNMSQWLQVYPILVPPAVTPSYVSSTVVGGWARTFNEEFSQCRVGMKINSADDAGDTGTNAEQVTVTVTGGLN
jgi:hypothetical protein